MWMQSNNAFSTKHKTNTKQTQNKHKTINTHSMGPEFAMSASKFWFAIWKLRSNHPVSVVKEASVQSPPESPQKRPPCHRRDARVQILVSYLETAVQSSSFSR
jgi:hypothetical protein